MKVETFLSSFMNFPVSIKHFFSTDFNFCISLFFYSMDAYLLSDHNFILCYMMYNCLISLTACLYTIQLIPIFSYSGKILSVTELCHSMKQKSIHELGFWFYCYVYQQLTLRSNLLKKYIVIFKVSLGCNIGK